MAYKNLELYVHIPFCMKKCDYCDFLSFSADERTQRDYVAALCKEIEYYGKQIGHLYEVSTVFLGGGTPSWLDTEYMEAIMATLKKAFRIREDAEITVECNPGTVTLQKLVAYKNAGINRLSIGCQSADAQELKLLGRVHTFEQFLKTYELARTVGFQNINVDLISCLPHQTAEKFLKTLQTVSRLKPEHLSVYTLIIEEGTPFYERYKFDDVRQQAGMQTEELPTEDEAYRIYKMTQVYLTENGYEQYETSNYAKPGFACRHNIGYWRRENYLGLGLGAASLLENIRYSNTRDLYQYLTDCYQITQNPDKAGYGNNLHESVSELSRKEQMEEFMFLGLRMPEGVYRSDFEKAFAMPMDVIYRDVIEELKEQELLISKEGRVTLTDKGRDLSNYCMAKFLL
ncbi:MAG: oxygen-independent coproporphyrinogen III oxidase [Agathobacter sp.]|uniref:radical SAM family heme chaperone HemW n=1 Tax=Agathobacter sp. TaxID=2021311 RepID=UPI00257D5BA3|nr:radical SAM family heme chaperone HemW [Agathobacter sp.]MBQ1682483.1 oxygen-independent coproporphyrinogen III oxidase [Agathobacter sp.]